MNDDDDFFKIESVGGDALLFVIGLASIVVLVILSFLGYFV